MPSLFIVSTSIIIFVLAEWASLGGGQMMQDDNDPTHNYDCHCAPVPPEPPIDNFIHSPRLTDRGEWGPLATCESGTFVKGMILRIDTFKGDDDTSLNAIHLFCGYHGSLNLKDLQMISSLEGENGDWTSLHYCKEGEIAFGFDLRAETESIQREKLPYEQYSGNDDNVGATGLRLLCSGTKNEILEASGPYPWGLWSGPQFCPPGMGICGLMTQVEPDQGTSDDSALNNADMLCCDRNLDFLQQPSPQQDASTQNPITELFSCICTLGPPTPKKETYEWERVEGGIATGPTDKEYFVKGGFEYKLASGREDVYICREMVDDAVLPGKAIDRNGWFCFILVGGEERTFRDFDILTNTGNVNLHWVRERAGDIPLNVIPGFHVTGSPVYIARCYSRPANANPRQKDNLIVGQVFQFQPEVAHFGFTYVRSNCTDFELLVFN